MYQKTFIVTLLLFITYALIGMELHEAYEKYAQDVIDETLKIRQGMPNGWRNFCQNRVSALTNLANLKESDIMKSVLLVNPLSVAFSIKADPTIPENVACFWRSFADNCTMLTTHRLHNALKCYDLPVKFFENDYTSELEIVDSETYNKKLDALSSDESQVFYIQEAGKLATKILEKNPH